MIVVRLQTVIAREIGPTDPAVLTVGSIQAGTKSNVIGDRAVLQLTASEDFSDIPAALSVPYTYWGIGGIDPDTYGRAAGAGRISRDIPVNHSPRFAPVLQPTLDTGTQAMVTAALAWLT
jgi:hippurate hydrolase